MNDALADNLTFEQALAQLDLIVRQLEDGQTDLETSLVHYETGIALLKRGYAQLRQAEQRVMLVTGVDGQNQPVLEPFDHAATAETAPRARGLGEGSQRPRNDQPEIPF